MYLARREFGKQLRVYPLKSHQRPCAWPFNPTDYDGVSPTTAALAAGTNAGVAAIGYTRSGAIKNLELALDAGIDELTHLEESQ